MLSADQIRRLAGHAGLAPEVLERDYALVWLLYGIYRNPLLRDILIFKGGTAIRKVYFPETWRLSEDLDFTIVKRKHPQVIESNFKELLESVKTESGMGFELSNFIATLWTVLGNIKHVGPLNTEKNIALDITLKERLVQQSEWRTIDPGYPDLQKFDVQVYSLIEILVEKIRAIFQRSKARDYYDVWRRLTDGRFDREVIRSLVVKKCETAGVGYQPDLIFDEGRLNEVRSGWNAGLEHLTKDLPEFDAVISALRGMLAFL